MTIKSPFPGLDPYLERYWGDAHQRFILYSGDALQTSLPQDLLARVEERVYVESQSEDVHSRRIVPDAFVAEAIVPRSGGTLIAAETDIAASQTVRLEPVEVTESVLEIRERDGGRVVTVIEFLSPSNKIAGAGRRKYRQKQREVLQSSTNLVEFDLIRTGRRSFSMPNRLLPLAWRNDALVCIRSSWRDDERDVYSLPLRQRLAGIPIPLRPTDRPLILDLQAIHDQCYINGRYGHSIDYSVPPEPPLDADDANWANELLASTGRIEKPAS